MDARDAFAGLAVDDLRSFGIEGDVVSGDLADTLMVRDPAGNSIAWSLPKDPGLMR